MRRFKYKAKDQLGKSLGGIVEAADESRAVVALKERNLTILSLNAIEPNLVTHSYNRLFNHVNQSQLTTFTRQLSTMITTGLTISEALTLLRDQSPPVLSEIVDDVLRGIEGGSSLAAALAKHPGVFNQVYISLVAAGETAGVLDQILARLADNLEKQREFGAKVKGAMIYPVIVIIGMIIVTGIMMVFVIPKLLQMYKDFQTELPAPTLILISITDFAVKFWWLVLAGLVGLGWLFRTYRSTYDGRRKTDAAILRIPIYGKLQMQVILTEMTRTFGLLVGAGVSIIDALNITADAITNTIFSDRLYYAAKEVEKGVSLGGILREAEEFPPIVPQMIMVGEETGKMDEVLGKLSRYFEQESEQMVKGLTSAIEPLIMIVLGLGVGFLLIAVILPIYNLTSQIQ